MTLLDMILRHSGRLAAALAGISASAAWAVETLAVGTDVVGTTPVALGYNLGHFAEPSNAADWFRYSGADSARLFMDRKALEGADDKDPWGDGVTDQASFFARRGFPDRPGAPLGYRAAFAGKRRYATGAPVGRLARKAGRAATADGGLCCRLMMPEAKSPITPRPQANP